MPKRSVLIVRVTCPVAQILYAYYFEIPRRREECLICAARTDETHISSVRMIVSYIPRYVRATRACACVNSPDTRMQFAGRQVRAGTSSNQVTCRLKRLEPFTAATYKSLALEKIGLALTEFVASIDELISRAFNVSCTYVLMK